MFRLCNNFSIVVVFIYNKLFSNNFDNLKYRADNYAASNAKSLIQEIATLISLNDLNLSLMYLEYFNKKTNVFVFSLDFSK